MAKRSKFLLFTATLLLVSYGFVAFVEFVDLLYRMHTRREPLEKLLLHAFNIGRVSAPLFLVGFVLLIGFVISISLETRKNG